MTNPLFNLLGGTNSQMPQTLGALSNIQTLMNQFEQFRNQVTGDPQKQVQEMLDSGKITQAQFEQVAQLATQFQKLIGK